MARPRSNTSCWAFVATVADSCTFCTAAMPSEVFRKTSSNVRGTPADVNLHPTNVLMALSHLTHPRSILTACTMLLVTRATRSVIPSCRSLLRWISWLTGPPTIKTSQIMCKYYISDTELLYRLGQDRARFRAERVELRQGCWCSQRGAVGR